MVFQVPVGFLFSLIFAPYQLPTQPGCDQLCPHDYMCLPPKGADWWHTDPSWCQPPQCRDPTEVDIAGSMNLRYFSVLYRVMSEVDIPIKLGYFSVLYCVVHNVLLFISVCTDLSVSLLTMNFKVVWNILMRTIFYQFYGFLVCVIPQNGMELLYYHSLWGHRFHV